MHVSIEELRQCPLNHIVSLGRACETAYNLRRHYNFGSAYPFDWWVTDDDSLEKFLHSCDVDEFYSMENLDFAEEGRSVIARNCGILLHHEFPRQWGTPGNPIREDFRDHIKNPMQRTAALLKKFLSLNTSENRILFVRNDTAPRPGLIKALEALFPDCVWSCAFVTDMPNRSKRQGWKGDLVSWDEVLGNIGVTLDLTGHKPFSEDRLMTSTH